MSDTSNVQWLNDRPGSCRATFPVLDDFLANNHYSQFADQEDEPFEIDRFGFFYGTEIKYCEADKRLELLPEAMIIFERLQSVNVEDELRKYKGYVRLINMY